MRSSESGEVGKYEGAVGKAVVNVSNNSSQGLKKIISTSLTLFQFFNWCSSSALTVIAWALMVGNACAWRQQYAYAPAGHVALENFLW